MKKENVYVVPQIEVIEVEVENGFAASDAAPDKEGYEEGESGEF